MMLSNYNIVDLSNVDGPGYSIMMDICQKVVLYAHHRVHSGQWEIKLSFMMERTVLVSAQASHRISMDAREIA